VSFGSTAAVLTSIGLIVGLATVTDSESAIVGSLLIVGIADNLSDSLSVHVYQESEGLAPADAFASTVMNFLVRAAVTATFVAIVLVVPHPWQWVAAVGWGGILLGMLTGALARRRGAPVGLELARHLGVTAVVIALSRIIGLVVSGQSS
jgi:VIT1/CCC1 family predicted Fe2+/Mn2+ transporter